MSPNDAELISNECLWVLMQAKEACPSLYEWAMSEMDISDEEFQEAFEIIHDQAGH